MNEQFILTLEIFQNKNSNFIKIIIYLVSIYKLRQYFFLYVVKFYIKLLSNIFIINYKLVMFLQILLKCKTNKILFNKF
jgi:hypothetical protein